jgi:hypothetical protein
MKKRLGRNCAYLTFVLGIILGVMLSSASIAAHILINFSAVIEFMGSIVPSVRAVGSCSGYSGQLLLLSSVEWILSPIYLGCFIAAISPFSKGVRQRLINKFGQGNNSLRRSMFFWFLILAFYVSGDIGIVGLPTFFNGKFLTSEYGFKSICDSNFLLALYAIAAPLLEAFALWNALMVEANFDVLFFSPRRLG